MSNEIRGLAQGSIDKWPGGFAASLAGSRGLERCCDGHETPEEALEHGRKRYDLVLTASWVAWKREARS